ncbi:MAG: histidinol dehydrogenase [Armatimonadota bacterium]|nr:histidinol dehydrogenase [Armatimonadota bacterium]MDR5703388.1 histidinol dehydrogenase [Armatimonadota bacterium]
MDVEIIRLGEAEPARLRKILQRANHRIFSEEILGHVRGILEDVRRRGDEAILEATRQWDRVELTVDRLPVGRTEIHQAYEQVDDGVRKAIEAAIERTRRFNELLRPRAMWLEEIEEGMVIGAKVTPVESVGVYVPAGKGAFPSTCVTIVTPAVMAGVQEIAIVLPPRPDGSADPAVLVAADMLGVHRVFRCNGVAGIAGLAFGTATLPRVQKVVGPGNPYVVAAQLAVQSYGVDMSVLLGPTECVVLADGDADPKRVALDLLNEAEHGEDSAAILVTIDEGIAREVRHHLEAFLQKLPSPRREYAMAALSEYGGLLVARDMEEAVAFINLYAPEHLQIATRNPWEIVQKIRNAGEVLIGQETPFSAANYAIGVPAALPTGGAARYSSGVTILSFLKLTSLASLDPRGLERVRPVVERLGHYENFPAHVMAVTQR